MSVTSTFEAAFIEMVRGRINDANFTFAWALLPKGSPVDGRKEVVFYYAPGGERTALLAGGISAEQGRVIQVNIFTTDPQTTRDAALAIHQALDGKAATLSDGSFIFNVIPQMQDIDLPFDNDEQVYQTTFDYSVRMIEG